ncbi:MAG: hypothetical protein KA760_18595 [Steroidobacteraceae bacterium]|nr:hypothetical protein [Steroidobacteraceae bacterium]
MGRRGPAKGSAAAKRCGPYGLAAKDGQRLAASPPPTSPESRGHIPPLPTKPPAWLPKVAAAIYRETLPRLLERATAADLEVFCAWVLAAAEMRRLARARRRSASNRSEQRAQARILRSLGDALGLTPIGRARLPQPEHMDEPDADEAETASQLA